MAIRAIKAIKAIKAITAITAITAFAAITAMRRTAALLPGCPRARLPGGPAARRRGLPDQDVVAVVAAGSSHGTDFAVNGALIRL
ncbi:hypothetical protein [Streptomyces sp. NBC_01451]|uniref:hypothetical protein n=1 Tax=Streptomyces sp. NBC_01451 TaxID=2903872 RepID=UPI002E324052|nr:hypothetical protein [Streptomyces sp. NBC_01451]